MIHTFPKEDFKRESLILRSMFKDDVYELLRLLDVMVAGGTLTSLFSNRDINDLDLYFRSWDDLEVFVTYMFDTELRSGEHDLTPHTNGWNKHKRAYRRLKALDGLELKDINFKVALEDSREQMALGKSPEPTKVMTLDDLYAAAQNIESIDTSTLIGKLRAKMYTVEEHDFVRSIGMTDKSIMFSNQEAPVMQCIGFGVFEKPQDIFDKFDFTINMGAFCFGDETWHFDNNFLKHIGQKVLVVNPDTDYPIISMLRASKYQARGYTISRRETMKLGLSASRLKIDSWQDAKKHLSGMYGTNVEKLFTEKRPFSFDLLFDKLDSAGDKIISQIATDKEKGDRSKINSVSLQPVSQFRALNSLRMHTGRPHINKVWGVCKSKRFYLMEPERPEQRVHVGMTDCDEGWEYDVTMYFDEADARSAVESMTKNGGSGGVLMEVEILRPSELENPDYDQARIYHNGEKDSKGKRIRPTVPSAIIRKYIESTGDFT